MASITKRVTMTGVTVRVQTRGLIGAVQICDLDNRKIVQFAKDRRNKDPGRGGLPLSAATIARDATRSDHSIPWID